MEFQYDGHTYQVNIAASDIYSGDYLIQLSDKRYLKVLSWLESYPPQPQDIAQVQDEDIDGKDLVAIAFLVK